MRLGLVLGGAAALALAAGASARAGVTYGSTSVSAYTYALSSGPKGSAGAAASDDFDDSDTLLPGGLDVGSTRSTSTSYRGVQQSNASDTQDANITLSSASAGTASFSGASSANVLLPGGQNGAQANFAAAGKTLSTASYDFSVDGASTFNFAYALSETNIPNLSTSYVLLFDPEGADETVGGAILAQNTSGTASFALVAGDYELDLRTSAGGDVDLEQVGVGSASGSHDEQFSFNITSAAPEPSAWALMIAGVAVAGGALRARRRGAAFA